MANTTTDNGGKENQKKTSTQPVLADDSMIVELAPVITKNKTTTQTNSIVQNEKEETSKNNDTEKKNEDSENSEEETTEDDSDDSNDSDDVPVFDVVDEKKQKQPENQQRRVNKTTNVSDISAPAEETTIIKNGDSETKLEKIQYIYDVNKTNVYAENQKERFTRVLSFAQSTSLTIFSNSVALVKKEYELSNKNTNNDNNNTSLQPPTIIDTLVVKNLPIENFSGNLQTFQVISVIPLFYVLFILLL